MHQSHRLQEIHLHLHLHLRSCRKCQNVCGPPVHGLPDLSRVMLIGQAPGRHEGAAGKPFAHTAGKTLFRWLAKATGATENELRKIIYFSAVARCFPGKAKRGKGDRPPSPSEIANCREHLKSEIEALKPTLMIAVGKVAIVEVLRGSGVQDSTPLQEIVGQQWTAQFHGHQAHVIALPHPSGISCWPHTEIGRTKLKEALGLIHQSAKDLL